MSRLHQRAPIWRESCVVPRAGLPAHLQCAGLEFGNSQTDWVSQSGRLSEISRRQDPRQRVRPPDTRAQESMRPGQGRRSLAFTTDTAHQTKMVGHEQRQRIRCHGFLTLWVLLNPPPRPPGRQRYDDPTGGRGDNAASPPADFRRPFGTPKWPNSRPARIQCAGETAPMARHSPQCAQ